MARGGDWILDLHFDELVNGVTLLERVLKHEREAVREKFRRELDAIPEDVVESEEGIEIRVSEREREIASEIEQYCQEIPRILMNNMVVATWSVFESYMVGMARSRITAKSDLSDEGFKMSGKIREMKHVQEYFTSERIILPSGWDFVDIIREIRNQIVHDNGIRHVVDDVTDPVELTRHKRTVKIDKFVEEREAQGQKGIWYYCDGILSVSAEFCREITNFLRDYVKATSRLTHIPFDEEALRRRMRESDQRSRKGK